MHPRGWRRDRQPALGGNGTDSDDGDGGAGAAGATTAGIAGQSLAKGGGGGGGIGRIRLNTKLGTATVGVAAVMSPAFSDATTATQAAAVVQ